MQSAHALAMNELNKIRENNITELEEKRRNTHAAPNTQNRTDLMKGGQRLTAFGSSRRQRF